MKKKMTNHMAGLVLAAITSVVLINCSKEQNNGFSKNINEAQATMDLTNAKASPGTDCGIPLPEILQVEQGNKLAYKAYATGVQIWEVRRSATDPNSYSWINIAPSAKLYQLPDFTQQTGTHYGGPSWEFSKGPYKGEKTVASKLQGEIVNATAVPWLLLKANDVLSSPGNKVTFIQRVCTTGGVAPAIPASESNLGQKDSIPYTAVYLFYEKKD